MAHYRYPCGVFDIVFSVGGRQLAASGPVYRPYNLTGGGACRTPHALSGGSASKPARVLGGNTGTDSDCGFFRADAVRGRGVLIPACLSCNVFPQAAGFLCACQNRDDE